MSSSANSNALVASNGSGSNFAQQGNLDWVALGTTQYSASLAVLGRLAKAGIDTLTVAFGQSMCTLVPIGPYDQKVLAESMQGLTAKSVAADLIWFGVGIRHVLRDLVQTSQGCSLVAPCAALTEAHSILTSALVMYKIAKECGGAQELTPSVEQWEALIRVAAPVFNGSTFGLRIAQMAKFGKPPQANHPQSPHPTDLAKLLLSIGQIVRGSLQSVSVQGDCCCSWIAAWTDFVLGLRVLVRDVNGTVVYANYRICEASAQVYIDFLADEDCQYNFSVQSSHVLRPGTEFIQRCFQQSLLSMNHHQVFSPGRLRWENMLSDTFGAKFEALVKQTDGTAPQSVLPFQRREAAAIHPNGHKDQCLSIDQLFARLLAIAIIIITTQSNTDMNNGVACRFFHRACENIPELRQCSKQTLFAIERFLVLYGPEECILGCPIVADTSILQKLVLEFLDYLQQLCTRCSCEVHGGPWLGPNSTTQFCLSQTTHAIFQLVYLFDHVIFDTPLQPTVYGLRCLYDLRHRTRPQQPRLDAILCISEGIEPVNLFKRITGTSIFSSHSG